MTKNVVFVCLLTLMVAAAYGQAYKGQIEFAKLAPPVGHYQDEYTFDTTLNAAAWTSEKKGLQVSFASTDELYFRSEVPALEQASRTWEETGWRGERLNKQILVWSPDTLNQVRVIVKDLKNASGKIISSANIKTNLVRYVISNYPYGARDATCGTSHYKDLYLMPDRFESFERFDLPGKTVRPVWLSIDVPAATAPGSYKGIIEVKSEHYSTTLNVQLNVQSQLLPKPTEWKHRLDLWQNPWTVAWINDITPWSADHLTLLKKHLKLYADAGGKYITTYAVHSPWADNSYMIEGGMIEWIKRKNGAWKFDYKIFDQYVELAMSVGVDKAITIYTPVPWGFRFRYMDEQTGNYISETWEPGSVVFKAAWMAFLTDLKKHLEQKGWFEKTYIGINENPMEQTMAAIKVVKEHSKKWKITYAGDWHPALDQLLDDYCFLYGKESDVDAVRKRSARGQTTTYYVCCNPPLPNNFVFSPPIEGRWLSWYTAAHGYDGFLRWAYDAWPADPARDARHTSWPAGDCFLVYPGGNSCIRYEKLREGIVDFEKLRIIKALASRSTSKSVQDLAKRLDLHLKIFLTEKDFDSKKITADVDEGKKMIAELTEKLTRSL